MRRRKDSSLRPPALSPALSPGLKPSIVASEQEQESHHGSCVRDFLDILWYLVLIVLILVAAATLIYLNVGSELGDTCSVAGALVAQSSGQLFVLFVALSLCSQMLYCFTQLWPVLKCVPLRKVGSLAFVERCDVAV